MSYKSNLNAKIQTFQILQSRYIQIINNFQKNLDQINEKKDVYKEKVDKIKKLISKRTLRPVDQESIKLQRICKLINRHLNDYLRRNFQQWVSITDEEKEKGSLQSVI